MGFCPQTYFICFLVEALLAKLAFLSCQSFSSLVKAWHADAVVSAAGVREVVRARARRTSSAIEAFL